MRRSALRLARFARLAAMAGFAAGAQGAPPRPEDTMTQRVEACTGCHGRQGRAASDGYYPRIAGKPAGYLYQQLLAFRDGRRSYAPMTALLDPLSDAYLREIAEHFAALDLPHAAPQPAAAPPALLTRGRELALRGDAARAIPACVSCHGERLTGVVPALPGLVGLPRDYVVAQLGAWRSGNRRAREPDCMARVAERLTADDIGALSHWLAAQPVPAGGRPAAALPAPAPLRCGSVDGDRGPTTPAAAPPASPELVARGAYLARAGNCAACHTARGGAAYAGGRAIETPFGAVYASNLTPDVETGIGAWTPAQFRRALHEGRSRDGRLLYPAFPYLNYTRMTGDDTDAIHAYLRSLPPVRQPNRPHELRWPYREQWALALWRAIWFRPGRWQADTTRSAEWNRGAYLVESLGHCNACHAPRNRLGAAASPLDLSGGLIPVRNWYAPSLHSDAEAGVAAWSVERIVALLKTGASDGATVLGPMAEVVARSTQHLADADLRAIAVFLQALPPAPPRRREAVPPAAPAPRGARLYEQHCARCHGAQGEGVPGLYAALAGNRAVTLDPPANAVQVVLAGGFAPATAGRPRPFGMPPFGAALSDTDIAAVLSHVRTSWGNAAAPVGEFEVHRLRARR